MGIAKQGSKPTGQVGYFIGRLMNLFHTGFYRKYYGNVLPERPASLLDIGCGGGSLIKYLSDVRPSYKLFGLDHSEEMVTLSKKVNKKTIAGGQTIIECGSVVDLPYDNNSMDIVIANETVQFWPDILKSFSEIYRVLKENGSFYIINRYPPEGSKWRRIAILKDESDYKDAFDKAGFKNSQIDLHTIKGWIIATSQK